MECFFRSLKNEWVLVIGYINFSEVVYVIINYIVGYYSLLRLYDYNGGLFLNELENWYWKNFKVVVSFSWLFYFLFYC